MSEMRKKLVNDDSHDQEPNLGAVFDQHIKHEFQDHDVDATMLTMISEPYVHHVPVMTGGFGFDGVYNFYKNHFIGRLPADIKIVRISRTVGKEQVGDELMSVSPTTEKLISCYSAFYLQVNTSSFLLWW